MNNTVKVVFFILVTALSLWAFSTIRGSAIVNSTINSTTIGATTPSTVAATTLTSSTSAQLNGSLLATGTAFKHTRVASCTVAAPVNSICSTTVTWPTPAFPDANYTAVCVSENSGAFVAGVGSHTATNLNVNIQNAAGSSISVTLDCIGVHD
jgi:hypothetical protein